MISTGKHSAIAIDAAVFPDAVGPASAKWRGRLVGERLEDVIWELKAEGERMGQKKASLTNRQVAAF
jgi:hypothetical protein